MKPRLILALGVVWSVAGGGLAAPPQKADGNEPVLRIETSKPVRRDFTHRAAWGGRVEAIVRVPVKPLIAGQIVSVEAPDELRVRKGQVVFELGGADLDADRATLAACDAALRKRLDLAARIVERKQRAADAHLASLNALQSAEDARAQIEAELATVRERAKLLEASSHVRAPISGVFTRRRAQAGQRVAAGETLGWVVDPDRLRIVARVYAEAQSLRGLTAKVDLPCGQTTRAKVAQVLPESDALGARLVWLEGAGLAPALKPGETVAGRLILETRRGALAVPMQAIARDQRETPYVFVQTPKGYEKRRIQIGLTREGFAEVLSGVASEDAIVTRGAYQLFWRDFSKTFKVED